MKKILYLHQYFKFPDQRGGTRSYDLSRRYIKEGFIVEVITSSSDETIRDGRKKWKKITKNNLIVHYIYFPYGNDLPYYQRSYIFLKFLWYATFKMLSLKADLVIATSTPLTIGIPALVKKWIHGVPFIFEVRDVWPETVIAIGAIKNKILQKVLYRLERIVYKSASFVVPLSVDMKRSIDRRFPNLATKTEIVIENISELDRFSKFTKPIDLEVVIGFKPHFSVLYAGTFGKVNGLEYVVDLARRVENYDNGIVFILIGKGGQRDRIISLAMKHGVYNRNVFFLEPVSKDELPSWYNAVNMGSSFVIPINELWANSANKFFDTLASARPILINHGGWQADVIKKDECGFILPPLLTDESVKNFVDYTRNSKLIQNQKENALRKAKESYSLDIAAGKYLGIIRKSINTKPNK